MKFSYFLKMQIFYPDKTHYHLASIVKNHKKITRPDKAYKKLISFFKSQSIYLFFGTTCQELHIDKHLWEGESLTSVRAELVVQACESHYVCSEGEMDFLACHAVS